MSMQEGKSNPAYTPMNSASTQSDKARGTISIKFVHIGHHKSGSTFLQYQAFPKLRALKPPPSKRPDGKSNIDFQRAVIDLVTKHDFYYDFESAVSPFYDLDFNFLSTEAMVGYGTLEGAGGHHIVHTAHRLRRLFGDTGILFIIRNQKHVVPSLYLDDIDYGYISRFSDWFKWREFHNLLDWFRYAATIETYQNVFGKERVKVVLFEDLFKRETFADILSTFDVDADGVDAIDFALRINESMTAPMLPLSRWVNRFVGTPANAARFSRGRRGDRAHKLWVTRLRPKLDAYCRSLGLGSPNLTFDGIDKRYSDQYHEDNIRTSELIGVDLSAHGYPQAYTLVALRFADSAPSWS